MSKAQRLYNMVNEHGKLREQNKPIEEYESFKTALRNIVKNSNRTSVSKSTKRNYKNALEQFLEFVNSEEGISKTLNPDDLIKEAQGDVEKAKERIRLFFLWLQGEEVPGFRPWSKKMRKTSACTRAYAQIRGFYSNNNIVFGKWKTPNISDMVKEAIQNDLTVPFFKRHQKKIYLDRAVVKRFLANIHHLRDKAIFLAMLSSSHDSGDLFKLNVGDFTRQKDRDRFYFEGQRGKTGVRFRCFMSIEATEFVRQYIEQSRAEAKDSEPLFVTSGENKRMSAAHLSAVYRDASKKLGVEFGNGIQNPFRPKRLRHIFRTGMTHGGVDEGYIHVFMGHRSSVSQQYLEKPLTELEFEYEKGEPFLTVFSVGGEGLEEIASELAEWKTKTADLNKRIEELEAKLQEQYNLMNQKIEEVTARIQREFYEKQVSQSDLDEQKMQEEISREEGEFTEEDKEQIERAKKQLEKKKPSTKTIKTDEEPKKKSLYDEIMER